MPEGTQPQRPLAPRCKPLLKLYNVQHYFPKEKQQQYCIGRIQTLLRKHSDLGPCCSDGQFARQEHIPIATLRGWLKRKHEYLESVKRGSNTTLDGHGQLESVSFGADLVKFKDSVRDIEKLLTTANVVTWLTPHQQPWLNAYLDGKLDQDRAYKGLLG
ncbi:hypothetical protein AaE_010986 [Aphanomyces astaci]|uniref:Uncharacterized protein n=1 Tax=Aphanomyces astaci TaxID=112090 RepID=A0A6A4ZTR2_APHAT|nr:hypothetical protein AaE_010986 [Aphanomyces astaci]